MTSSKIYVGNLSWNTTDDTLRDAFQPFGLIQDSIVMRDRDTGRSRGFGFVTYQSPQEVENAIANMNDQELDGRRIKVNLANVRGSGGGGGGGGGNYNAYGGAYGGQPMGGAYGGAPAGGYGAPGNYSAGYGQNPGYNQGGYGAQAGGYAQGGYPNPAPGGYAQGGYGGQAPQPGYPPQGGYSGRY